MKEEDEKNHRYLRVPEMLKAGHSNEQSQSDTRERGGAKGEIGSDRLKGKLRGHLSKLCS